MEFWDVLNEFWQIKLIIFVAFILGHVSKHYLHKLRFSCYSKNNKELDYEAVLVDTRNVATHIENNILTTADFHSLHRIVVMHAQKHGFYLDHITQDYKRIALEFQISEFKKLRDELMQMKTENKALQEQVKEMTRANIESQSTSATGYITNIDDDDGDSITVDDVMKD